jgi:hypothetical protein
LLDLGQLTLSILHQSPAAALGRQGVGMALLRLLPAVVGRPQLLGPPGVIGGVTPCVVGANGLLKWNGPMACERISS